MANITELSPKQARQEFRENTKRITTTCGLCEGYLQAGVFMLPTAFADDFEAFCRANSASFPLLYRSKPGEETAPEIVDGLDIRTDLGLYSIFEKDKFICTQEDLLNYPPWDDMVSFYIGCSQLLDGLAQNAGVSFRNVDEGKTPMVFDTGIPMTSVGPFKGSAWVSLRPCKRSALEKMVQVTGPHDEGHGAPIHIGDSSFIRVKDIRKPLTGDQIDIRKDEVAVFWACSGSGQQVIHGAEPSHYVAHYGESFFYVLITDMKAEDYQVKHKPSSGDLKHKVVTMFENPDFMSLLSNKALDEITKIGNSGHKEHSLARAALVLSHSCCVAIATPPTSSGNDDAFTLAKALLEVGKKVILFTKDDGMVSAIREEAHKAFPSQLARDLEVLGMNQVNMQDKDKLGDLMEMNEVSRSKFIIVLSQNADSLDAMERLADSTPVKGTSLNVSPWGYDVTAKALSCLRRCPIHSRYVHRGIGKPSGKAMANGK